MTGHYLPVEGRGVSAAYFQGDDYVDHEAQSAGDHQQVLQLLRQHHACDPVIEIGCATGGLLAALDAAGFQAIGLDISEWAVTALILWFSDPVYYIPIHPESEVFKF